MNPNIPGVITNDRQHADFLREIAEPSEVECSFRLEFEGRTFELVVVNDDAAIIEHGTDELPMMFDDVEDGLRAWVDFREQFDVLFTKTEIEMLDVLKILYDRETGRAD